MQFNTVKKLLDQKFKEYNQPEFIANDPISVPHKFTLKQDIEIAGFYAAIFAWGQRKTIIAKSMELMQRMDYAPYQFMKSHVDSDLQQLLGFKHRTFNDTDLLYTAHFFKSWYNQHDSLEEAFLVKPKQSNIEFRLNNFQQVFFNSPFAPQRTRKHIPSPLQRSACKRLNMYLRWMVRKDKQGVDFGLWTRIKPAQLVCPLDLHVLRVAHTLGLLTNGKSDWNSAMQLTHKLKAFDANDPVKYDFALFGLGIMNEM
ncbi:MAG: TIGR02757 family protein [Bacteroidia bacterium]|nr:TIGR02757 family protein [Bacteroidia bacterium]